jgi:hypothetical protein
MTDAAFCSHQPAPYIPLLMLHPACDFPLPAPRSLALVPGRFVNAGSRTNNLVALALAMVLSVFGSVPLGYAGSATWSQTPVSSDWNNPQNWQPMTVPNGPTDIATFAQSSITQVILPADTTALQITFAAGAPSYHISPLPGVTLILDGLSNQGIVNDSAKKQTLEASSDDNSASTIRFASQATAADATLIASSGPTSTLGGRLQFLGGSTGRAARVQLFGHGLFDISSHAPVPPVGIGTLEGDGTVLLGANDLVLGGVAAIFAFSGDLQGTGKVTGSAGIWTMLGNGVHEGPVGMQGGRLLVQNMSGPGPMFANGNNGAGTGTLGGNGVITGPVSIAFGGTLLAGDASGPSGGLTLSNDLNMAGDIAIVLGPSGTHSTLHRAGGTWTLLQNQRIRVVNAGAEVGVYHGIITGLSSNPLVNGSWSFDDFGFSGSFSYDGAGNVDVNLLAAPAPPTASARSEKTHGASGAYRIDLPLSGPPGIECRSGGAAGNHTVLVFFSYPPRGGYATVKSGEGIVSGFSYDTFPAQNPRITLSGVTDRQTVVVTLSGVETSAGWVADVTIPLSVLVGDVSGNGLVSASDIGQVKTQSGQPVTSANFRNDITVDGTISASDIGLTKSVSGNSLPLEASPEEEDVHRGQPYDLAK